jgi:hypothetical protein
MLELEAAFLAKIRLSVSEMYVKGLTPPKCRYDLIIPV